MPRIQYRDIKIGGERLAVIERANEIIAEYRRQGFDLTLRQLYYQFVARGLIPNSDREYKKLGDTISDGRLAGLVDWEAIVDRTRNLRSLSHWQDPGSIMRSAAASYRVDKWAAQPYHPEVWVEKDALLGVVGSACEALDVPYFSCRGYTSQSEMWAAGRRLAGHIRRRQSVVLFHLGDHDPSGKDMTRDIVDRLELFMGGARVERLALNLDQVERYSPPPNPAKITDSRAGAYIAEFGDESWELDALEPAVLSDLIQRAVLGVRDDGAWEEAVEEEERARSLLSAAAGRWEEVETFLNGGE